MVEALYAEMTPREVRRDSNLAKDITLSSTHTFRGPEPEVASSLRWCHFRAPEFLYTSSIHLFPDPVSPPGLCHAYISLTQGSVAMRPCCPNQRPRDCGRIDDMD